MALDHSNNGKLTLDDVHAMLCNLGLTLSADRESSQAHLRLAQKIMRNPVH